MAKTKFINHDGEYYNVNNISRFSIKGADIQITFSNGDFITVNSGHLDMNKVVDVINPDYGSIFNQE